MGKLMNSSIEKSMRDTTSPEVFEVQLQSTESQQVLKHTAGEGLQDYRDAVEAFDEKDQLSRAISKDVFLSQHHSKLKPN